MTDTSQSQPSAALYARATSVEPGSVTPDASAYGSTITTRNSPRNPATVSSAVRATRKISTIIVVVNSVLLAFWGFLLVSGVFWGPILGGHIVVTVAGILMAMKARRSSSKLSHGVAGVVFTLTLAINVLLLVVCSMIASEMKWKADNIEGYDIPPWIMGIFIVPDMASAPLFLAGAISAFTATCKWRDGMAYETADAGTSPV